MTRPLTHNEIGRLKKRMTVVRHRRDLELEKIRQKYRPTIESLAEALKTARANRPKKTAADKYMEPPDAMPRHCKTCGGELLLATMGNVAQMKDYLLRKGSTYESKPWVLLRAMRQPNCCWRCAKGQEVHSLYCVRADGIEDK